MKDDGRDPRPMLAIFAVLVVAALWRAVSSIRIDHLLASAASLAPFALGALAIATALAPQRFYATRRALAARVTVAVVPADEFDPKPEIVLRFAAEVARADRSLRGWLDRPAHAVRVQLTNDREGRLVYLLEVPARSREALRTALRDYEGAELRRRRRGAARRGAARRRGQAPHRAGPRQGERRAPAAARPRPRSPAAVRRGDGLAACRARRARDRLRRPPADRRPPRLAPAPPAEARGPPAARAAPLTDGGARQRAQARPGRSRRAVRAANGRPGPRREAARRRAAVRGADPPLLRSGREAAREAGDAGPPRRLCSVQLRQLAARRRAAGRRRGVLRRRQPPAAAGLRPPPRRRPAPTGPPAGPHRPGVGRFPEAAERPLRHRKRRALRNALAGAARAAALHRRRPRGDPARPHQRRERQAARRRPHRRHLLHLRRRAQPLRQDRDGDRPIRPPRPLPARRPLPRSPRRRAGADQALPRRAEARQPGGRDRRRPSRRVEPAGLEPLRASGREHGRGRGAGGGGGRRLRLDHAVERAEHPRDQPDDPGGGSARPRGPGAAPRALPDDLPTPDPALRPRWREAVLPFLPKASQRFWLDRFPLLAEEAITPLTNLVDRLRGSTPMTALLGQSASTYRVREAMDEGWIVLAHPGSGGTRERLLANLLLFDLLHAAKGRAEVEREERKPFWVFLDEVQTYDGVASGNLAALLEQSAKFGLRAVVLNQNPERLNPQTLNALTTNRSHLLTSALNSHAAALLTKEWGRRIDPEAVTQLDRYRFIAQVTDRGRLSKPFALEGIRVEDVAELPEGQVAEPGGGAVARTEASEVIEHLETLDERILAALRKRRKEGSEASSDAPGDPSSEPSGKPQRSFFVPEGDGQG